MVKMVVVLMLVFLMLIGFEVPKLVKEKQWRELVAFSGFMLLAMGLSFAKVLELPIPNPTKPLNAIFDPIGKLVDRMLR